MSAEDLIPGVPQAKLIVGAIVAAAIVAALAGGAAWFYLAGRHGVETQVAIKNTTDQRDAAGANVRVANAVTHQADGHARTTTRLSQEAADAHRQLDYAPAPGAGFAGAETRIDPHLGRLLVCRLRRLRVPPEDAAPCELDGADNAPH